MWGATTQEPGSQSRSGATVWHTTGHNLCCSTVWATLCTHTLLWGMMEKWRVMHRCTHTWSGQKKKKSSILLQRGANQLCLWVCECKVDQSVCEPLQECSRPVFSQRPKEWPNFFSSRHDKALVLPQSSESRPNSLFTNTLKSRLDCLVVI